VKRNPKADRSFLKPTYLMSSHSRLTTADGGPAAPEPASKLWDFLRETGIVFLAFLLGILGVFDIPLVGALRANEVLLAALAPIAFYQALRSQSIKRYRWLLYLGLLYLAGQMVADLYRHNGPEDYLRGWARIGVALMALLVSLLWFVRRSKALLAFVFGFFLVAPIRFVVAGELADEENAYKMSFGSSISLGAFLFLCVAPKALRVPAAIAPFLAGIVAILRGGRSLAGITILALATYWLGRLRLFRGRRISRSRLLAIGALISGTAWGIFAGYRYAASTGVLGEKALEKYEAQSQTFEGGNVSLFLAGRLELLFSGPKILASPIIGYGSWAKDVDYVWNRAVEVGLDPEEMVGITEGEVGLIPAHSHLFGGWLEAGLPGLLFWGFALFMAVDVLIRQKFIRHPELAPIINYFLVYFLWDVFFSPFGGERRLWSGVLIAWMASIYYKNKAERKARPPRGSQAEPPRQTLRPDRKRQGILAGHP
jgi:hypothetical protein